jgi:hypothetical protein
VTSLMKRPSDAFVGTVLGLIMVLLVPRSLMHSEEELFVWMTIFAGLGAVIGTVTSLLRRRGS